MEIVSLLIHASGLSGGGNTSDEKWSSKLADSDLVVMTASSYMSGVSNTSEASSILNTEKTGIHGGYCIFSMWHLIWLKGAPAAEAV